MLVPSVIVRLDKAYAKNGIDGLKSTLPPGRPNIKGIAVENAGRMHYQENRIVSKIQFDFGIYKNLINN